MWINEFLAALWHENYLKSELSSMPVICACQCLLKENKYKNVWIAALVFI